MNPPPLSVKLSTPAFAATSTALRKPFVRRTLYENVTIARLSGSSLVRASGLANFPWRNVPLR